MSLRRVVESFRSLERRGEITAWVDFDAQPGLYTELPEELSPRIVRALEKRGIRRLYSHQAEAFEAVRRGRHLVAVTPTASGKTLCYNLPILDRLTREPEARALYLFPTKALAQDQLAELQSFLTALDLSQGAHTYDGDTPADMRRKIRTRARLVLTNPDMLHTAILPHHTRWLELFRNLKYVVVDEMHTYRGVFGSHVSNVFRRLKRIARFYDSRIQFLCASATIANPGELAELLLEEPVEVVSRNGAPRSSRTMLFYNPPLTNPQLGLRRSALSAARRFAARFLKGGLQTLVFAPSRVQVEVLLRYLQEAVPAPPGQPPRVRGYRGGYLPRTRRRIERLLRDKELLGVVSTNALELGVDIGSLEVCVLVGYPGSIAATWQRVGRAGRRNGHAAAVLVARNLPLDQFIVNHPEYFLARSPEHGRINPDNLHLLVRHIQCAAFELPFEEGEVFGKEDLEQVLEFLVEQGMLHKSGRTWSWTDESFPADSVSLRNMPDENFVVLNRGDGNRSLAEVDFDSAPELIHPGALYLCEGKQYHVDRLDYDGRRAYVREIEADYYTEAVTYSSLRVIRSEEARGDGRVRVEHGEVHLTKKVPGFKKIRFYTGENLGYGEVELPEHELHTNSCWLSVDGDALEVLNRSRDQLILGFLGLAYSLHHLASLLLMCDVRDLGRSVGDRSARWFVRSQGSVLGIHSPADRGEPRDLGWVEDFAPTVFLYDNLPGGAGFSETLFQSHPTLIRQSRELISACGCRQGCPSCVGPADEIGEGMKQLTLEILAFLGEAAWGGSHGPA